MKSPVLLILFIPLISWGQYCLPTQGHPAVVPIIDRVTLGDINNSSNGFALTEIGYSDYTDQSTVLSVGETYSITIETADFFPHNIGIWIDYDKNEIFSDDEVIDIFEIGGNNPMVKTIDFTPPSFATTGFTRMRVRAMLEPFGPWMLSMHPCLPADGEGEIEDYTIEINDGINNSLSISRWVSPISKIDLGEEIISVGIKNIGNTNAEDIKATFKVNGNIAFSETIPGEIMAGTNLTYTFPEKYDFSQMDCADIAVELSWSDDEINTDNLLEKNICNLSPQNGEKIWYLHSNINGGLEPLGGDPFQSTTNVATMDAVFGAGNWSQGFFETSNIAEVFSDSTCLVFLDGSHDHSGPIDDFLRDNKYVIENWVAGGGNLFLNYSKELGENYFTNVGFDDTYITIYSTGQARPQSDHPALNGPFQPIAEEYGGFYFANAVIVGKNMSPIAFETDDESIFYAPVLHLPILAEKNWGEGRIIFGGLSPSEFMTPVQASMNLRANILDYLYECQIISSDKEEINKPEIKVFPNPANSFISLNNTDLFSTGVKIKIYSSSGQVISGLKIEQPNKIDISQLSPGLYYLELQNGNFQQRTKFVKY